MKNVSKKRKRDLGNTDTENKDLEEEKNLKKRKNYEDFVSPSDIRNFMIKDTLVDWLKMYYNSTGNSYTTTQTSSHSSSVTSHSSSVTSHSSSVTSHSSNKKPTDQKFLLEKGIEFERLVVDFIDKNYNKVITVSSEITDEKCAKVIELMENKTPIIHSAPFKNKNNGTHGIIDLLIRNDIFQKFFKEASSGAKATPSESKATPSEAKDIKEKFFYFVVDIKFSSLPLRADGEHLLNSGNYPFYKGQLYIYSQSHELVNKRYAFVLGRRWNYTSLGEKYSCLEPFDKVGTVDFVGIDSDYPMITKNAINWIKQLRKNGKEWTINPPSKEELYPNMCLSGQWDTVKNHIAYSIGDITQIWYCGIKQRKKAIEKGIVSWRDERCNSSILGMNGSRGIVIDHILNINRQDNFKISRGERTDFSFCEGDNIFVDFELFIDASLDYFPEQPKTSFIFMIGVWSVIDNIYTYTHFTSKKNTADEELRIIKDFINFISQYKNPKIFYWYAEQNFWNTVVKRHRLPDPHWVWVDIYKIFITEPIVIKDCFKFSLKSVSSALFKHGFIKCKIESVVKSGLEVAIQAWNEYEKFGTIESPENNIVLKDILVYNKFDVNVIQEIFYFIKGDWICI
jgi:hypothetical protein